MFFQQRIYHWLKLLGIVYEWAAVNPP